MSTLKLLDNWEDLLPVERRNKLLEFESVCKELEDSGNKVELPPTELHCNGVYAREILIPKGTALVGEIHLQDQINVVSQGVIRVATEEGVRTITAPCTFISPAGTKRAGFALEDTVWTVFHATKHTNEEDIRRDFIAPSYTELDKQLENKQDVMGSSSGSSGNNTLSNEPSKKS